MADRRKKILFISHDCSLTGAPRELLLIVKHLDKTKYEPIVVTGTDGPLRKYFAEHAEVFPQELFCRGVKYLRNIRGAFKRFSLIKQLKPDLVYCNTVMTSKWLLYAKLFDIPTLIHVHELSNIFDTLSSFDRYLIHNYTDVAISASTAVRKYLLTVSALNPASIVVFHESIEIPETVLPRNSSIMALLRIEESTIIIGMIGRIAHVKGSDLFLDVAKIIKESLSPSLKVKFIIIGGTPHVEGRFNEWLEDEIAESEIKDDFIITGSKENIDQYLSLVDIFVLPSREDPFPLVLLEAMAASKPIVAFAVGGVPEAVGNQAGFLIEPLNVGAMTETIIKLINDPDLRKRMGAEARKRVDHDFNIERNISRVEEIIEMAIQSGKVK
ncbi:MAG: glycosyltransferase family 4 protein [Ignavibacteriales bacterium]|nr:glycosyltransferase family 4 protein [Ignavibacteriales bacterium]